MESSTASASPSVPHSRSVLRRAWDVLTGCTVDAQRWQNEFDAQFRHDSAGHFINTWLACLTLIVCCLPHTLIEIWGGIPLGYALLRWTNTWRTAWRPFVMPLGICVLLLIVWQMLSTLWSIDPRHGWNEVFKNRWLAVWLMLWPVMDQRGKLIAALKIGLFLGIIAQVIQFIARRSGIPNVFAPLIGNDIPWLNDPDRLGGWWHPLAAGSILLISLGLHLGPALFAQGRKRVWGVLGAMVSCAAIVMTGTRGAILVMPLIIGVAVVLALVKIKPAQRAWRIAAGCGGLILIAVLLTFSFAGDKVVRRGQLLISDIRQAVQDRNYTTDNGARVQMALWSFQALHTRPLTGVGAGSYEAFSRQIASAPPGTQTPNQPGARFFEHAHNSILHIGATLGLVGVVLALGLAVCAVTAGIAAATRGGWDVGPGLALLALLLVSMTDPVHFNTQTSIVWYVVLGLCVVWMPKGRASTRSAS